MRFLVAICSLCFVSTLAQGADLNVCVSFIPCGTYVGSGNWYDINNKKLYDENYSEKIIITAVDEKTVNLKVYFYEETPEEPWADANMEFAPNGQFTFTSKEGVTFGTGFCINKACTIAFYPSEFTEQNGESSVNSFVNILRFEGEKLKRFNMVSDNPNDLDLTFQRSELRKQESH